MHRDNLGLIVQANGDGGDCAARTGNYYFAHGSVPQFRHELQLLINSDGKLIRHPGTATSAPFWSDPQETSRDQTEAVLLTCLQLRQANLFERVWKGNVRFGLMYLNGDLVSPQMHAARIRASNFGRSVFAVPLLMALDVVGLIGNALLSCGMLPRWKHETREFVASSDADNVGDDVLFTQHLLFALMNGPTPAAMYAANLVRERKPTNYGNTLLDNPEDSPLMGALSWYHRADSGGNPEIGEVYRPLVRAYIDERA